jgi:hypothetical protein
MLRKACRRKSAKSECVWARERAMGVLRRAWLRVLTVRGATANGRMACARVRPRVFTCVCAVLPLLYATCQKALGQCVDENEARRPAHAGDAAAPALASGDVPD